MSAVRWDGADLLLAIRLTPRARQEKIGGQWRDEHGACWLQASVSAPPDKGRANVALIELLAQRLGIGKSSISLETGATNRLKRLRITDCTPQIAHIIQELTGEELR